MDGNAIHARERYNIDHRFQSATDRRIGRWAIMQPKEHWENVYTARQPDEVSWYQPRPERSLQLIRDTDASPDAAIIDVGGGASTLIDHLLDLGFGNVTVLDLSAEALGVARQRLGERAAGVQWLEADITDAALPAQAYDVWHDRAVLHFLTQATDRQAYVRQLEHALKPGGHVIIATFAEDGPTRCSGLPVRRYGPDDLQAELGSRFTLIDSQREGHATPSGTIQQFMYCRLRKAAA